MIKTKFIWGLIFLCLLGTFFFAQAAQAAESELPVKSLVSPEDFTLQKSEPLMNRANEFYKQGEFKKAIILYEKSLSRGGDREAIAFNIGNCYYRLNDLSRSAASYKKALRLSQGNNYSAMMNLAGVLLRLKEYGACIGLYRRYLKKDPGMTSAWLYLADAYTQTGDLISAQLALEKAHRLEPTDVSVLYQLSEIHVAMGEFTTAIQVIENAYMQNPEEIDFLYYMGDLYRMQNDFAAAAIAFRKGLALEPGNYDVLYKLADVLEQDEKTFLAMDCLQRALILKPDFTDASVFLGNLAFDLKMWDRSSQAYLNAVSQKNQEGIEGLRNIAFEYQKMGQSIEAIALLQQALKLEPTNSDLQTDLILYQGSLLQN